MNKKIKNRIVFYTMLLVLFVIVNIVVSFGYLRGRANNNESVSTIAIKGVGEINVTYSSNTPNIVVEDILPGYETVKKFSVTSNISSGGTLYKRGIWYQIKLIVDTNGFLSRSLVYSLSLDDNSSTDGITALPLNKIAIPNGANSDGILIGTGYFSSDNVSHIYKLKINYVNLEDVDQSNDYQKKFAAHVVIDNPRYVNLTFDLDGGRFENLKLNSNSTMKVAANSTIDFPIPIKENYAFMGWEEVSGNVSANNNVITTNLSDIKLKALWQYVEPYEFDYTGGEQEFIAEYSGYYKIEVWGASGADYNSVLGGNGAYAGGQLYLIKSKKLYIYTGEEGINAEVSRNYGIYGFNGGSGGNYTCYNNNGGKSAHNRYGGGATDIRLTNGEWNNFESLKSRIMVAAGGASAGENQNGSSGGGVNGLSGGYGTGGTQTSSGDPNKGGFGYAATPSYNGKVCNVSIANGAGSGYYGGGATNQTGPGIGRYSAGSGSSFVSGHSGCNAISEDSTSDNIIHTNQSEHYSGCVFTDTVIKGGNEEMPTYDGTGGTMIGNDGPGHARITYLHS